MDGSSRSDADISRIPGIRSRNGVHVLICMTIDRLHDEFSFAFRFVWLTIARQSQRDESPEDLYKPLFKANTHTGTSFGES